MPSSAASLIIVARAQNGLVVWPIDADRPPRARAQITDLQKQEIEEKQEIRLLIRLHIFYLILLINL